MAEQASSRPSGGADAVATGAPILDLATAMADLAALAAAGHPRVLVIKLGAFGDFIQVLGPMQALCAHHRQEDPKTRFVLLTTKAFAGLAQASGLFDRVLVDARPGWGEPRLWLRQMRALRALRPGRVYDLQRKRRTRLIYRVLTLGRDVAWSGTIRGCSHYQPDPPTDRRHAVVKIAEQLKIAGIDPVPDSDLSFLQADIAPLLASKPPAQPFALLVPGAAPHRPAKRWPAAHYAALARQLAGQGILPVLIGTAKERADLDAIAAACPEALNLCDRTGFPELASLGRSAACAIGNDTGPMHLLAGVGCPMVVLFSHDSDPEMTAPIGPRVTILRRPDLADLPVDDVVTAVEDLLCQRKFRADRPGPRRDICVKPARYSMSSDST